MMALGEEWQMMGLAEEWQQMMVLAEVETNSLTKHFSDFKFEGQLVHM